MDNSTSSSPGENKQAVDLIVVGSGPAGISTVLHLLQLDPSWAGRMLVLEKTRHPRHKLCGGAVTTSGLNILRRLGFQMPLPLPQATVDDLLFSYGRRTVHVRGDPVFIVFQRAQLDAFLAARARQCGVTIHEDEPVHSIAVEQDGVIVRTGIGIYHAQAVAGADGARGLVKRSIYGSRAPTRVARTLEVVHPAPETAPHFTARYALFDFTQARRHLQGYFWDFPSWIESKPHFNRGLYDARISQFRRKAHLPRLLEESLLSLNAHTTELRPGSHPIHWFSPANRFSSHRLLLAGDAAGADPLFGEGIAPALGYGQVAAQAIQQAFIRRNFSFQDYRKQVLLSPVGGYLLLRWYVAWWSYRLSGQAWFMHALWTIAPLLAKILPRPGLDKQ